MGQAGTGLVIAASVAGGNPLVGGGADIDVRLNARIQKATGFLTTSGNLMGDGFPNAEVFLRDAAGYAVLLHHYETLGDETGPYVYLPGGNSRLMGAWGKALKMNPIGLLDAPDAR